MGKKSELAGLKPLEPHQKELLTYEGFERAFIKMIGMYNTNEEAYEAVERQYKFIFGERRYKNHESFRAARTRMHNLKRAKSKQTKKT